MADTRTTELREMGLRTPCCAVGEGSIVVTEGVQLAKDGRDGARKQFKDHVFSAVYWLYREVCIDYAYLQGLSIMVAVSKKANSLRRRRSMSMFMPVSHVLKSDSQAHYSNVTPSTNDGHV